MKSKRGKLQSGQRRDRFGVHLELEATNAAKVADHDLASSTPNRPMRDEGYTARIAFSAPLRD
jgi:hypothetical protein